MQRWIPAFTGITGEGGNDRVVRLREQVREGDGVESRIPGHIATEGLGDDAERNHRAAVLDVRSSLESNDLAIDDCSCVADLKTNGHVAKDDRDALGLRKPRYRGTKGLSDEANLNEGAAVDDFRRSVDGGSLAINSYNVSTNGQNDDPRDRTNDRYKSNNASGDLDIAGFIGRVRQKTIYSNTGNRKGICPDYLCRIIQRAVRCIRRNSAKLLLGDGYGHSRNKIDFKAGDCLHRNDNYCKHTSGSTRCGSDQRNTSECQIRRHESGRANYSTRTCWSCCPNTRPCSSDNCASSINCNQLNSLAVFHIGWHRQSTKRMNGERGDNTSSGGGCQRLAIAGSTFDVLRHCNNSSAGDSQNVAANHSVNGTSQVRCNKSRSNIRRQHCICCSVRCGNSILPRDGRHVSSNSGTADHQESCCLSGWDILNHVKVKNIAKRQSVPGIESDNVGAGNLPVWINRVDGGPRPHH